MGRYFKPWRRKIGVVTLLTACLCAAGWARSRLIQDTLTIETGPETTVKFVSASQALIFARTRVSNSTGPNRVRWWKSHRKIAGEWEMLIHDAMIQRDVNPFSVEHPEFQIRSTKYSVMIYQVPYWPIVIPLTLLSTWLLLSNLRVREPQDDSKGST